MLKVSCNSFKEIEMPTPLLDHYTLYIRENEVSYCMLQQRQFKTFWL